MCGGWCIAIYADETKKAHICGLSYHQEPRLLCVSFYVSSPSGRCLAETANFLFLLVLSLHRPIMIGWRPCNWWGRWLGLLRILIFCAKGKAQKEWWWSWYGRDFNIRLIFKLIVGGWVLRVGWGFGGRYMLVVRFQKWAFLSNNSLSLNFRAEKHAYLIHTNNRRRYRYRRRYKATPFVVVLHARNYT